MRLFSKDWLKHQKWSLIRQGMTPKEADAHLAGLIAYEKAFEKAKRKAQRLESKKTTPAKTG